MKILILFLITTVTIAGCSPQGRVEKDINLADAIPLIAQSISHPAAALPGNSGSNTGAEDTVVPGHNIFSKKPGTLSSRQSFASGIDPVGTSISTDFDGDGIINTVETTTNIWVSDYPVIETRLATPVSMKIEILKNSGTVTTEITNTITSNDIESTTKDGTENIHRTEVNTRTTQFQDYLEQNSSSSSGLGGSASGSSSSSFDAAIISYATAGASALGFNLGFSQESGYSKTTTQWRDVPFRNNLESTSKRVKSDSAFRNARKFKSDIETISKEEIKIKSDAGYIRAALYIKNQSVNMPVRISNVLCSFMFETPTGQLIPVQSFRLRNEDYSLFEIDVYGGTEFGPYVIELNNLNTIEIEEAIYKGYTPKIFIVDYEMKHVQDSNYRSDLLSFNGDNVKIVEENAKGRTALLKIFGPNIRKMFRVAAFSAVGASDICSEDGISQFSPGVSMRETLKRLSCSGISVEFENYVLDLSESFEGLKTTQLFVPGIKSISGIKTQIPCTMETTTGTDGQQRTACVQKPISQWTAEEAEKFGIWVVFANGRFYSSSQYELNGDEIIKFKTPAQGRIGIPIAKGIDSTIWVGDHYELTYLRLSDFQSLAERFGTNPIETGIAFPMNTRWDKDSTGSKPFYPNRKSHFLGRAALGDKIELTIKLKDTFFLAPDFGANYGRGAGEPGIYKDFSYDFKKSDKLYTLSEAIDFELSLGLGGQRSDWANILRDVDSANPKSIANCGYNIDFINQQFTICIRLPLEHDLIQDDDALVSLYLRPNLNNAYRNSIWPKPADSIYGFQAKLKNGANAGSTTLLLTETSGTININDSLKIDGEDNEFVVINVTPVGNDFSVELNNGLSADRFSGIQVGVNAGLSETNLAFYVEPGAFDYSIADEYFPFWNVDPAYDTLTDSYQTVPLLPESQDTNYCSGSFSPVKCLGHVTKLIPGNWVGFNNYGNPFWNSWADAANLDNISDSLNRYFLRTWREIELAEDWDTGSEHSLSLPNSGNGSGPGKNFHHIKTSIHGNYEVIASNQLVFPTWYTPSPGQNDETGKYRDLLQFRFRDIRANNSTFTSVDVDFGGYTALNPAPVCNGSWGAVYQDITRIGARIAQDNSIQNKALLVWDRTRIYLTNQGTADPFNSVSRLSFCGYYPNILQAMLLDTETGTNNIFTFASGLSSSYFGLSSFENKALGVWLAGGILRGKIVDIQTGNTILADFNITNASLATNIRIKMNGTRALLSWINSSNQLRALVVDTGNGILLHDLGTLSSVSGNLNRSHSVSLNGNVGAIAWHTGGTTQTILAQSINLDSGHFINPTARQLDVVPNSYGMIAAPRAIISNQDLLVIWEHRDSNGTSINGRFLDINSLQPLEPEFQISGIPAPNSIEQTELRAENGGELAFVAWRGGSSLYNNLVSLKSKNPIRKNPLEITSQMYNTTPWSDEVLAPQQFTLSLSGNYASLVWIPPSAAAYQTYTGRTFPYAFAEEPIPLGTNNFFTSPLIERNYEIKAQFKDLGR